MDINRSTMCFIELFDTKIVFGINIKFQLYNVLLKSNEF